MKKLVVFAAVVLVSSFSFGQNTSMEAVQMTQKLTHDLNLTADQAQKVSDIYLGIAGKNEGVLNNTQYSEELKAEILASNKEACRTMIKNVLTPEQITLWETKPVIKKVERTEEQAPKTLEH